MLHFRLISYKKKLENSEKVVFTGAEEAFKIFMRVEPVAVLETMESKS